MNIFEPSLMQSISQTLFVCLITPLYGVIRVAADLSSSPFLQIFLDMAVLVDAQGEMLDNIESQVIWYYSCFNWIKMDKVISQSWYKVDMSSKIRYRP